MNFYSGSGPYKPPYSLAEAITGASLTFASAARTPDISQNNSQSVVIAPSSPKAFATPVGPAAVGISPGKVTELRMKKLHELRELQESLIGAEYAYPARIKFIEQKQPVLNSLRKLTH